MTDQLLIWLLFLLAGGGAVGVVATSGILQKMACLLVSLGALGALALFFATPQQLLIGAFAVLAGCGAVGVVATRSTPLKGLCLLVTLASLAVLTWLGGAQLLLTGMERMASGSGGIEGLLFRVFAILACGGAIAVVVTQNVVRMAFWLVVSLGSVSALFFLLHADFLGAAQLLIYVGGTVVLLVFGVMLTASGPTVQIKTSPAEAFLGAGVGLLLLFVLMFSIKSVPWGDLESRLHSRNLSPEAADSQQDERLDSAATDAAAHAKAATEMMTGAKTGEEKLAAVAKRTKADADLAKVGEARTKSVARNQAGRTVRQLGLSFFGVRPDLDLKQPAGGELAPGFLLPFEIVSIHLLVVLVGAAYLARAKRKVVPGSPTDL